VSTLIPAAQSYLNYRREPADLHVGYKIGRPTYGGMMYVTDWSYDADRDLWIVGVSAVKPA
jgi:hypothetical protein